MSNSLDDRLKNEYSSTYTLIVRDANYYPRVGQGASLNEIYEKIGGSAVPGIDNEGFVQASIDPFRQTTGKFWTFENTTKFQEFSI